jgi:hypothetical protein
VRLSDITARCRELGDENPETNVERIVWAECVADGVVFESDLTEFEREEFLETIDDLEGDVRLLEAQLEEAKDELATLRARLKEIVSTPFQTSEQKTK